MVTNDSGEIRWHFEVLTPRAKEVLDYLSRQNWLKKQAWYLAGGTALALQVGHRTSLDLDFFTSEDSFAEEALTEKLSEGDWKTTFLREGTIYGELMGVKISFIAYPFFVPKNPFQRYGAVNILDQRDIAVMKIVAISQRGTKRDFVDLYWYCLNREPLEIILKQLPAQYPKVAHNYHHILTSLTYFADADPDPIPKVFFKASWKEIKKYFQKEVPRITRELLDLSI